MWCRHLDDSPSLVEVAMVFHRLSHFLAWAQWPRGTVNGSGNSFLLASGLCSTRHAFSHLRLSPLLSFCLSSYPGSDARAHGLELAQIRTVH